MPRDALVLREGGAVVFRVNDGVAERLAIETGIGAEDRIEVLGEVLTANDRVVVRGAELLRDGQAVSAQ